MIPIDSIRADTQAQPRTALMMDTVESYTERMAEGDEFPPLVVFFDGSIHWLGDGFHRYHAAKGLGLVEFPCDVRDGGLREAILHSVGANGTHGLQRSDADKRRAVMKLLTDPEWSQWSDREIARRCRVHHTTVARTRSDVVAFHAGAPRNEGGKYRPGREAVYNDDSVLTGYVASDGERKFKNKHGGTSVMNTDNIGSRPKSETERLEDLGASRARAEQIARDNANAFIGTALGNILDEMRPLPSPRDAARRCSAGVRYAHTAQEFERVARWFSEFAAEWRCIDEEGQAHVAAE